MFLLLLAAAGASMIIYGVASECRPKILLALYVARMQLR